jgi:hypothetical protein
MSDYLAWSSPAVVRLLAWTLLHFLWQGMVLAALFAGLMATFRSAATRYALAVSIMLLMVASPIATFLFLRQSSTPPVATSTSLVPTAMPPIARPAQAASSQVESGMGTSPETFIWLVRVWIAGVIFFSLRTAAEKLLRLHRVSCRPAFICSARLVSGARFDFVNATG